jgi:ABC-type multidrug transport system ATPase subunit
MDVEGARITARGIAAKGRVFEGVSARVEPGELAVVVGASGSGRTSLLLALSGRMRLVAGQVDVSGFLLPEDAKEVRQLVVPARVRPGFELESRHRIREVVSERRMISRVSKREVVDAFALLGIDPEPRARISELHPLDHLLLAIALAAAEGPAAMLVDDVDAGLTPASRTQAWAALRTVAATGTTVLASSTEGPSGCGAVIIRLPAEHDERADTAEELLFLDYPGTIEQDPWQDEGVR